MRILAVLILTSSLLAGCIPSYPMDKGELGKAWALNPDATQSAEPYQVEVQETHLPSKWIIRQRKSVIWSTVSIVRASDKLKQGTDELDISISPTHTQMLAEILVETRQAIEDMRRVVQPTGPIGQAQWAQSIAGVLAKLEHVTRASSIDQAGEDGEVGLAAEPMLQMMVLYLNEQAGGALLGDLGPGDIRRLRTALTQMVLRLAFAAAGKQQPEGLRDRLVTLMRDADQTDGLVEELQAPLLEAISSASAGGRDAATLSNLIRTVLTWSPRFLRMLEGVIHQWDRMDRVEFELCRKGDDLLAAVTFKVLPGKELRLTKLMSYQPSVVFSGTSRMVVNPRSPDTGDAVVTFEPGSDGSVDLRFEGVLYAIARLVLPLSSGALREVRIFSGGGDGADVLNVAVFMEAEGVAGDNRRLIVFQQVQDKAIDRQAFGIRSVVRRKQQVFNYLTPTRRYTYQRVKASPN